MRARPAALGGLPSGMALLLALLVLLGLASSGLTLPERADTRPLVPHDVQQGSASSRAAPVLAAEASVRRAVAPATSPAATAALALVPAVRDLAHQDADTRRNRLRLGLEIRAPPAGRFA
jgi:hypothetical protein